MGLRHPNHRLVKIHRNYTVEETAALFGVHRNTVRAWLRDGLAAIDRQRPMLILGPDLIDFLMARRRARKRPCLPGEIYCVRCRLPRRPAGGRVIYRPLDSTGGNLVGGCPECQAQLYRRVSVGKLELVRGDLDISMPEARQHIDKSPYPSVDSNFNQEHVTHE